MSLKIRRLTARSVASISKPGRHADGDGLYLVVDESGASRVNLAEARAKAREARQLLADGRNPNEQRRIPRAVDEAMTFGPFADALVDEIRPSFRNEKHRAQ